MFITVNIHITYSIFCKKCKNIIIFWVNFTDVNLVLFMSGLEMLKHLGYFYEQNLLKKTFNLLYILNMNVSYTISI